MTTTSRSRSEAFTVLRSIADAAARLRDEVENQRFRRGRREDLVDAHAALGRLLDAPLPEGTPDKFDEWCKGLRNWRANHTPLPERFDDRDKPPVLSNLARWFGDAVEDIRRGLSADELALAAPSLVWSKVMTKTRIAELLGLTVDTLNRLHGSKLKQEPGTRRWRIRLDALDAGDRQAIENAPPRRKAKPRGRSKSPDSP